MSNKNLGSLGLFSTDSPASDQLQFNAENWGDYFEEEAHRDPQDEENYSFEGTELIHVVFVCADPPDIQNVWWTQKTIMESKLDSKTELMQKRHDEACNCGLDIQVLRH